MVSTAALAPLFSAVDIKQFTLEFQMQKHSKAIHPKYYKHLKKGVQQNCLGTQNIGCFLAD